LSGHRLRNKYESVKHCHYGKSEDHGHGDPDDEDKPCVNFFGGVAFFWVTERARHLGSDPLCSSHRRGIPGEHIQQLANSRGLGMGSGNVRHIRKL
jgi:hypothetical protein